MLKIGEFARICGTSTQTIRYYDQEGILRADYVDWESGYRYYKPEKLTVYRKIMEYKDAGFTLEEIKQLLSASYGQEALFKEKAQELEAEEAIIRTRKAKLKALFEGDADVSPQSPYCFPLYERIHSKFIDDPEAIGRWELIGILPTEVELPPVEDWTTSLSKLERITEEHDPKYFIRSVTFLPDGCHYWVFFWSAGILYRLSGCPQGYCVANPYEIREVNGEKMMRIKWVNPGIGEKADQTTELVYRQIDCHAYNDATVRLMRDDVDLSFTPDNRVLGRWIVVDFVDSIDQFHPQAIIEDPSSRFYTALTFHERSICYRDTQLYGGIHPMLLNYTQGAIINKQLETVERYELYTIDGTEYLFVEHKSGDYIYGGMMPPYYVYRRDGSTVSDTQ